MKKCVAVLVVMMILTLLGAAWAAEIVPQGLELPGGSIAYPRVELADAALAEKVNGLLLQAGDVENRLNRMALLGSGTVKLHADYAAVLSGDVLSCVFSARGAVTGERATHVYTALNVDLLTGEEITFDDLFNDVAAVRAFMEEYLDYTVAPSLSAHLANSALTPLPEVFGMDASGLTLYYPIGQLSTLSDRAGKVHIAWCELRPYLRLEKDGVVERIGGKAMLLFDKDALAETIAAGCVPGLPVTLGGSVQEATDTYRMLVDPDLYDGGRMFQLEDGAFRGVYILTDSLTEKWDRSVIQGVRMDRGNVYGLCVGETQQAAWRAVLGAPDNTVTLDADRAEAQRLPAGTSDYYNFGQHQLRLHADEAGVLTSLFIH